MTKLDKFVLGLGIYGIASLLLAWWLNKTEKDF